MKKESLVDLALLVLRLALGAVFVVHGLQKFFPQLWGGPGIAGFAQSLGGMNVPQPEAMAWIVAGWELVGGAFVAVGILPRIAALGLLADMICAVALVHLRNGFFAQNRGFEYPMTLGVIALAIVIAGSGKYALQGAIAKKKK